MPLTLATLHSASFLRSHTVTHSTGGVKGMVVVSLENRQAHECSRACVGPDCWCCALGLVGCCHRRCQIQTSTVTRYFISLSVLALASGRAHVNRTPVGAPSRLAIACSAHRVLPIRCCVKHTLSSYPDLSRTRTSLTHELKNSRRPCFRHPPAPPAIQHPNTTQFDGQIPQRTLVACRTMLRPDACGPPHEARADARQ
jgi:hypothetical protein